MKMRKIFKFIVLMTMMWQISSSAQGQEQLQDVQGNALKFSRMLRLIDSYYVDTTNIEKITENAIVHMLSELDPHSVYISAEEVQKMNEPLEGSFEGIGISFNILRDTLMVVEVIAGGPSEKVGLQAGDRIIKIDNEQVASIGIKNSDVMSKLRGKKGSKVKLEVLRSRSKEPIHFTIVRDHIPIYSLDAGYMLNDEIGYIKINRFSKTTSDEVDEAIAKLKKNAQFNSLILDLRNNGGGFLAMAIELADQFLNADQLVVYTHGVHAPRKDYYTNRNKQLEDYKLVVLIDEGSASASEIVAGAIQDWDRGVIVGRRSFGKGLVQQPFPLTDGSIVRLTTSHYFTPSGRCIQKPYDEGAGAYEMDYYNRYTHGELFNKDSIKFDESKVFKTLKLQRNVYAGGGIMPDIFMPIDTNVNYSFYNQLLQHNILYESVLNYLDENRKSLQKKYTTSVIFHAEFELDEKFVNSIIKKGESAEIIGTEEGIAFAIPHINKMAKAIIARGLFTENDYWRAMNAHDKEIDEAIKILSDSKRYESILQTNKE